MMDLERWAMMSGVLEAFKNTTMSPLNCASIPPSMGVYVQIRALPQQAHQQRITFGSWPPPLVLHAGPV